MISSGVRSLLAAQLPELEKHQHRVPWQNFRLTGSLLNCLMPRKLRTWMDQACEIAHDRLLSVWDVVPTDGLSMVVWWKSLDGPAAVGNPTYPKWGCTYFWAEGWPMRSLRKSECHLWYGFAYIRLEDVESRWVKCFSVSESNLCRVGSSARAPATNVPCLFACFIMVPWLQTSASWIMGCLEGWSCLGLGIPHFGFTYKVIVGYWKHDPVFAMKAPPNCAETSAGL